MQDGNAYFVNTEADEIYVLSAYRRKVLEKYHPNWYRLNPERDYVELPYVLAFFKTHGKLISTPKMKNGYIGCAD